MLLHPKSCMQAWRAALDSHLAHSTFPCATSGVSAAFRPALRSIPCWEKHSPGSQPHALPPAKELLSEEKLLVGSRVGGSGLWWPIPLQTKALVLLYLSLNP